MIGRRLAHYEIKAHLGSGGMGDVYRATDTKLGRSVALKFLRDDVGRDPTRAARFRQEAKALASLNHPHIAVIHDQEEVDGQTFLVMEFVPGETLNERLGGRPLPLPDAIDTALQIIDALETAHDHGIVHRDLKPANIKITPDGRVKVLDFGLAKIAAQDHDARADGRNDSAMLTQPLTDTAVIVGTPAYMSPEQAKGLRVDRRADIFAFGCVLFEMLTGRRAFEGSNAADVVSRVLQREPDWSLLPTTVPPSVVRLLRLCVEKDPRQRRQSAGDVRIDLERARSEPTPATLPRVRRGLLPYALWAAVSVIAIGALAATWATRRGRDAVPELRLGIETPPTLDPMHFAVSPDAAYVVYAAPARIDERPRLYLRAMNRTEAQPLTGTDGARFPFWSPDSRSIGYFADRKLFRIDVAGGPPRVLAPAANPLGGAWGADGTVLFAPTSVSPLFRVPASGGKPVAATRLQSPEQTNHRAPSFLPDGRRFLFYAAGEPNDSGLYLGSLDGGTPTRLTGADSTGAYLPPDRVVFVQQGKLVARRIDAARGELSGDPVTVAAGVSVTAGLGWFSTSTNGTVAYRSGTEAPRRMTWFDHAGKILEVGEDLNAPAISQDGHYLAYDRTIDGNRDVWILDRDRGGLTPLTRHPAVDGHPVWSPDGSQIAFESQRNGTFDIWVKPATGGVAEAMALETANNEWPLDWSRDGKFLLFQRCDENYTSSDLLALPMTGDDRTPVVIADTPFEERTGSFSPDGRWVAYETDESGRPEVVVKAFLRPSGITRVSTDGGATPRWSADGSEIYFISPDGKVMAASVSDTGSALNIGKAAARFATHIISQVFTFQYARSHDGRFVVVNRQVERASASPITVLFHWKP